MDRNIHRALLAVAAAGAPSTLVPYSASRAIAARSDTGSSGDVPADADQDADHGDEVVERGVELSGAARTDAKLAALTATREKLKLALRRCARGECGIVERVAMATTRVAPP